MTTETRFTKDEWEHSGRFVFSSAGNVCVVGEPRGTTSVGYTELRLDSDDWAEAMANADLIAAAPELYAALESVQWSGFRHSGPTSQVCPECRGPKTDGHGSGCRIAAALAKARGETVVTQ